MRSWGPWMRASNKSVRVDSDHAHRLKWVSKTLPSGWLAGFFNFALQSLFFAGSGFDFDALAICDGAGVEQHRIT